MKEIIQKIENFEPATNEAAWSYKKRLIEMLKEVEFTKIKKSDKIVRTGD